MRSAVSVAGIQKTVHVHSFATHLPESGTDILHIHALPGNASIANPTIYTHLSKCKIRDISRPPDQLAFDPMGKNCMFEVVNEAPVLEKRLQSFDYIKLSVRQNQPCKQRKFFWI
jgi:hypothetical protein